jgi:CubicO group peptidase (beta-lactamase class C family)
MRIGRLLFAIGVIVLAAGISPHALRAQDKLPNTAAGKRVASYVEAFNSGDDAKMEAWSQANMTAAGLKRHTPQERVDMFHRMRGDMEQIDVKSVENQNGTLQVTMHTKRDELFFFTFEFDTGDASKVSGLRIQSAEGGEGAQNNSEPPTVSASDPAAQLAEYGDRIAKLGFTGAAMAAKGDKVLFEKGFGMADRAKKIPNTAETVVNIGSNTKDFTAVAILQLEAAGKLYLEDPITKYFKDVPQDKAGITTLELLKHTAGFEEYSGPRGAGDYEPVLRDEFLRREMHSELVSKPGEQMHYSNPGYSLLAAIIELISGKSYDEYLDENIFQPLHMTHTGFVIPHWKPEEQAHGYQDGEDWGTVPGHPHAADGAYWNLRGNGGMQSTLPEMMGFYRALWSDTFLPKAERVKMFPLSGPIALAGSNGIFFFIYTYDPAERVAVIVASTDSAMPGEHVSRDIFRLAEGREITMPPRVVSAKDENLTQMAGVYGIVPGSSFRVAASNDGLRIVAQGQEATSALFAETPAGSERAKAFNARAKSIYEAVMHENYMPLSEAIGREMPLERVTANNQKREKNLEEQFGTREGFEVLGTAPTGRRGTFKTQIRIDFEKGSAVLEYVWEGDQIVGVGIAEGVAGVLFYPVSTTVFASYDFGNGASVQVSFVNDGNGKPIQLEIGSGTSRARATRVE